MYKNLSKKERFINYLKRTAMFKILGLLLIAFGIVLFKDTYIFLGSFFAACGICGLIAKE